MLGDLNEEEEEAIEFTPRPKGNEDALQIETDEKRTHPNGTVPRSGAECSAVRRNFQRTNSIFMSVECCDTRAFQRIPNINTIVAVTTEK